MFFIYLRRELRRRMRQVIFISGKWLAIAVLAAAFLLASLLTMSAVSRRVREFGTLKALGWRSRRIVGQVLGESITIGIVTHDSTVASRAQRISLMRNGRLEIKQGTKHGAS